MLDVQHPRVDPSALEAGTAMRKGEKDCVIGKPTTVELLQSHSTGPIG